MAGTAPSHSASISNRHPSGLAALFLTEMWERLAFYLLLGILLLYVTDSERGGLGFSSKHGTEVYGTYLAFVYFTPFLGGLLADRYLGYRKAVFIGGLLMATGLFLLGVRSVPTLYGGLALLCLGNGLFKPNISAMVGNLYERGDPKRDAGFNIFYMGINLGAALSALLSAPLRNLWSFNTAFVGAGVGLLIAVTILTINWKKLAKADRPPERDPRDVSIGTIFATILVPAAVCGGIGWYVGGKVAFIKDTLGPITFGFITGMIPVLFYFITLILRAGPEEKPGLASLVPIYIAGAAFFMILHLSGGLMTLFAEQRTAREAEWVPAFMQESFAQKAMPSYFNNAAPEKPRPPEDALVVVDGETEAMFGAKRISEAVLDGVLKARPDVAAVDPKTSDYHERWGFLECGVYKNEQVIIKTEPGDHGAASVTVRIEPETATPTRTVLLVRQGGTTYPVLLVTQKTFDKVYEKAAKDSKSRLQSGEFPSLLNAELFTSLLNPVFVVVLTPIVVAFFSSRVKTGKPISTAKKMVYGMVITFGSLLIMAAAANAGGDGAVKVSYMWLVVYYLVITVGELCLSPVGLSLVTKLSPKRLVGLMMGGWFLSTSVGNKLAGFISSLEPTTKMFIIASLAPLAVAVLIIAVLPMLNRALKQYGAS